MTASGPRLGETFAEIPGALFGFGAYRWSVQWAADGVLVLVGMAGAEHTVRTDAARARRPPAGPPGGWMILYG
jgi:hypothetical protein